MKEESGAPPTLNRSFCLRVIIFFVHGIMSWIGLLSFLALSCWFLCPHPSLLLRSFIGWRISWSFGSSKQVLQHKRNTYHNVSPILGHRDPKQCADSPTWSVSLQYQVGESALLIFQCALHFGCCS